MSRIAIFGTGKIFNQYAVRLDFKDVAVIIDNDFYRTRRYLYGSYVISPDLLKEYSFDYVVIFNQAHSYEIHNQLVSMGIDPDRIVSWQYYMFRMDGRAVPMSRSCLPHISDFVRNKTIRSILDVESSLVRNGLRSTAALGENVDLVDRSAAPYLWGQGLYSRTVMKTEEHYDVLVCMDYFLSHRPSELMSLLTKLESRFRYIIVSIPFPYPAEFTEWADFDFSTLGKIRILSCQTVKLLFIDMEDMPEENEQEDMIDTGGLRLITVTHKPYSLPSAPLYIPVFAGSGNDNPMGIQGDAEGENISRLNQKINELTALYWAWKNTNYEYLGLCHYRRYFRGTTPSQPLSDGKLLLDILSEYDMIVTPAVEFWPESIRGQLSLTVNKEALVSGLSIIRSIIEKKYPDYLTDFDEYFDGHWMYPCNMFVTSRPILDRYCDWLFGIIIPAAEQFDASGYDGYSARIIGFIAERLLTLWILHNGISVYEFPVVLIEQA